MPYEQGHRKVSHKARHGKKHKSTGVHRPHRTKRPPPYESDRNADRRRRLIDLRAADLEDFDECE